MICDSNCQVSMGEWNPAQSLVDRKHKICMVVVVISYYTIGISRWPSPPSPLVVYFILTLFPKHKFVSFVAVVGGSTKDEEKDTMSTHKMPGWHFSLKDQGWEEN